jgi:subfamily B ATP-binding cassette protein MsbA
MNKKDLAIRIFQTEIKKYYNLIIICFIFMIISAATTAASAWLLDPAIKMIFVNKDRGMLYLIPLAIVIILTLKGISTFFVKIISIKISLNIAENIQIKMSEKILNLDGQNIINILEEGDRFYTPSKYLEKAKIDHIIYNPNK